MHYTYRGTGAIETKVLEVSQFPDSVTTRRAGATSRESLFPQRMPAVRTLEYAGACLQAREVGGDYFDFLDVGRERLVLVIGDIAGKGIAGALLMANLQANLRSQCTIAADEPRRFLRSVNQLFYENTADGDYATFFFVEYDVRQFNPNEQQDDITLIVANCREGLEPI